jgi:hypothetical protein
VTASVEKLKGLTEAIKNEIPEINPLEESLIDGITQAIEKHKLGEVTGVKLNGIAITNALSRIEKAMKTGLKKYDDELAKQPPKESAPPPKEEPEEKPDTSDSDSDSAADTEETDEVDVDESDMEGDAGDDAAADADEDGDGEDGDGEEAEDADEDEYESEDEDDDEGTEESSIYAPIVQSHNNTTATGGRKTIIKEK